MEHWSDGVMEYWKNLRFQEGFHFNTPVLHYSITPLTGLKKEPLESVLGTFGDLT